MRYHERLNIVFMRDNGPRHSIRVRRSHFYLLICFFAVLPFLCASLAWACWHLWQMNIELRTNVDKFETDYQNAEARAERLENLEDLLREENVPGRERLLRQLASTGEPFNPDAEESGENNPVNAEGPGHEEFPVLDTGKVQVSNVSARALKGNRIRISLDLHNLISDHLLSGEVHVMLVTAAGEETPLSFVPDGVGNFRINRFKRTVMTARIPEGTNLNEAQIILEVNEAGGGALYRNIFQVRG